jgi:SSS family solute:Na+ symporter
MSIIDWIIVFVPTLVIGAVAYHLQRHVKSVADFMAASRVAGRYLICNARGEMGMAVISTVASFEVINRVGFTLSWWGRIATPVGLFIGLLGFVIYRYRETRAMTLAQFFEIRYSKDFRIFTGILAFLSGVINYGIFPAVAARFFVYYCGMPDTLHLGGMPIPTFALIMAFYLAVSLFMTLTGGQLTIMVTDCLEGIISMALYFVVIVVLMMMFSWTQIYEAMSVAPAGKSLLDPFDTGAAKDFNIWYVLIGCFGSIYGVMCWQGGHAFNSCAASAHESKMGAILGGWRGMSRGVMFVLMGVCAYTYLHHQDFAAGAAQVSQALEKVSDPQIRSQMTTPIALSHLLPVGVKGIVCALFFFGLIACDGSYLHSWGSILIQDVILPFRKKPFTPEQHLMLLRWAITGVAVFGFLWSLFYHQTEYILMFFALTGAIYLGGAGSVVIGGLYWKKGTTPAAWGAMITGSLLASGAMIIQQPFVWRQMHPLLDWVTSLLPFLDQVGWIQSWQAEFPAKLPINGQVLYFFAMVASITVYVTVSLLTCKEDFNMDRMLHRGQYALDAKEGKPAEKPTGFSIEKFIGIDENFTRTDKWLSWSVFLWSMFWFVIFIIITGWNLVSHWPLHWWSVYWQWELILIPLVISVVTTVWFTWGGIVDLNRLFKALKTVKRDARDDGMVVGHHNLDEDEGEEKVPPRY